MLLQHSRRERQIRQCLREPGRARRDKISPLPKKSAPCSRGSVPDDTRFSSCLVVPRAMENGLKKFVKLMQHPTGKGDEYVFQKLVSGALFGGNHSRRGC